MRRATASRFVVILVFSTLRYASNAYETEDLMRVSSPAKKPNTGIVVVVVVMFAVLGLEEAQGSYALGQK
jgi:hypothetical protein